MEARICAIACSKSPEGISRWTRQAIVVELIPLEIVDYITDSIICEVMKKTKQLIKETRIPYEPGRPEKVDTVYVRNGVTDNFNTHSSSLYKAFAPEEARRLTERFEWHYTPKHGNWLAMAEIEILVLYARAVAAPSDIRCVTDIISARPVGTKPRSPPERSCTAAIFRSQSGF